MGSNPYMIVAFIVFLIVLRAFSLRLVLSNSCNTKKGDDMEKTKKTAKIVVSSFLETVWAMGVGFMVGQLST